MYFDVKASWLRFNVHLFIPAEIISCGVISVFTELRAGEETSVQSPCHLVCDLG